MLVGKAARRSQYAMLPAVDADHRDIGRVHRPRLRSDIDRDGKLAPVRADIVMLGARIPWLQRKPGPGQKIARAPGRDVGSEDVRLSSVGEPMVPKPIVRAFDDMRLDLGLLALF